MTVTLLELEHEPPSDGHYRLIVTNTDIPPRVDTESAPYSFRALLQAAF